MEKDRDECILTLPPARALLKQLNKQRVACYVDGVLV